MKAKSKGSVMPWGVGQVHGLDRHGEVALAAAGPQALGPHGLHVLGPHINERNILSCLGSERRPHNFPKPPRP